MMNRSVPILVFLTVFTFGIYGLVWMVSTKIEMNETFDAEIPTAILAIVPFVSVYWLWRWSKGVERATGGHMSAIGAFALVMIAGVIGMALVQAKFNTTTYAPEVAFARVSA